jgi:hypothetical protein
MSGYTHTTFLQARTELLARLQDSAAVKWTQTATYGEVGQAIQEALRYWNAATGYFRARGAFNTVPGVAFYDLPANLVDGSGTYLCGYTLKDRDLLTQIQYHLLEPTDTVGWTWPGTEMFTLTDVVSALERRRNQFLLETGAVLTRSTMASGVAPVGRVAVADSVVDIRRMAWMDAANAYTNLWREDEFGAQAFGSSWNLSPAATPERFSVSVTPPITVQIIPPCSNTGTLELIAVQTPASLDVSTGVLMNVPDDFCWAVKFGAMADLLGKAGQAFDPSRASYCEQRYREGVELCRLSLGPLQALVNDSPVQIGSVQELDSFSAGWQNQSGAPAILGVMGKNLVALSKVPDAGPYSVTLDVVRNAIIPVLDGDYLQVGREELDAILDYAQHLLSFKLGGVEFQATASHYDRVRRLAIIRNEELRAASTFQDLLDEESRRERVQRPRRTPSTAVLEA